MPDGIDHGLGHGQLDPVGNVFSEIEGPCGFLDEMLDCIQSFEPAGDCEAWTPLAANSMPAIRGRRCASWPGFSPGKPSNLLSSVTRPCHDGPCTASSSRFLDLAHLLLRAMATIYHLPSAAPP